MAIVPRPRWLDRFSRAMHDKTRCTRRRCTASVTSDSPDPNGEIATVDGLPLQGFVNAQEGVIDANPLYDTVAGYELGLRSGALTLVLF